MTETTCLPYDLIVTETPEAYLVTIEGDNYWFPRSEIIELDDNTIEVPVWLAVEKGLA